jgi:hypothetical protein
MAALEAEMTEQYSRNYKPIVGVAIVAFMLPTLFCKLAGQAAPGCKLLDKTAWVALGLLRSVILLADWQAVSAHLWDDSRLLQHLLQIIASIWSLLCLVAG